ncbi:hypothetical protein PoB_007230500 [Plakobranchus ocellatus]|uniref:Uncharacterized protein n=1 Tax=Plakobranchus ocellatus TaxID=259542 RepID=A0AAV4DPE9_9GAST|nr:hypothetical protein PoB_007230500 [Plakobranchus ocellatus]
MSSSDDSCDFLNFNLKELQALNHQVSTQREHAQQRRQRIAALKSTDNLHTSDEELDDSDRDVTYNLQKKTFFQAALMNAIHCPGAVLAKNTAVPKNQEVQRPSTWQEL